MRTMVVQMPADPPNRSPAIVTRTSPGGPNSGRASSTANGCAARTGPGDWALSSSHRRTPPLPPRRARAQLPRDGNRAWNINTVTVYEQLTSA